MKRLGITNMRTVVILLIALSLVLAVACGESATATPAPTSPPAPTAEPAREQAQPTTAAPTQRPSEPTPVPTAKPAPTPVPTVAGATGPEGTLNTGFREVNPYAAHPSLSSTIQAQFVGSGIGETPVSQDVNDVFQTELFSDWEVAEDGLTWTFTVRKGVPFHKGYGEMTADDFDMLLRLAVPTAGQSPASGRPRNWATKAVQRRHTLAPQHQGPGLGRTP